MDDAIPASKNLLLTHFLHPFHVPCWVSLLPRDWISSTFGEAIRNQTRTDLGNHMDNPSSPISSSHKSYKGGVMPPERVGRLFHCIRVLWRQIWVVTCSDQTPGTSSRRETGIGGRRHWLRRCNSLSRLLSKERRHKYGWLQGATKLKPEVVFP